MSVRLMIHVPPNGGIKAEIDLYSPIGSAENSSPPPSNPETEPEELALAATIEVNPGDMLDLAVTDTATFAVRLVPHTATISRPRLVVVNEEAHGDQPA